MSVTSQEHGRVKGPRKFLDTFVLQKIDFCASRKNQDRKLVQKKKKKKKMRIEN
jgi:hypothetical protein